ncbi:hypothetical protein KGF56_004349 [Candida oxycetoniae]|uniref:RING-type domain-containing protein n=1 Tax=Candida oxycetoniae TaxID=497107 RepID=A0AAI9WWF0_9ASCO|nr:uncharacterized protein KGF56_004349 [Candida oxycetoniae]KAI3402888.2 hypothetical protein KGF56_004349 [Candida oxycetoniae]
MSNYEEEHNISSEQQSQQQQQQQSGTSERGRNHETLSNIIDAFIHRRGNQASTTPSEVDFVSPDSLDALSAALNQLRTMDNSELAESLIDILGNQSSKEKGVTPEFLDTLIRIPVTSNLGDNDFCPICTNKFKDDKYPLIVKLPCGGATKHYFDLECIGPWLSMNPTCPMCRTNVLEIEQNRRKAIEEELRRAKEEDSEEDPEDGWDVYG